MLRRYGWVCRIMRREGVDWFDDVIYKVFDLAIVVASYANRISDLFCVMLILWVLMKQ
jgi:hypothetical protein